MDIQIRKWLLKEGKEVVFPPEPIDTKSIKERIAKGKPRQHIILVGPKLYDHYKNVLGL